MSSVILGACTSSPKKQTEPMAVAEDAHTMYMLVGSYATPEEEGIKVYRFNEETGTAKYLSGLKGLSNPSYLTPSADGERVYAVSEEEGESAAANALRFEKETGNLSLLNAQPTRGGAPCHIALNPTEKFVLTANYLGGSITLFSLDKEGKLQPESRLIAFNGHGPNRERQAQPHLHYVAFTPDGKYLLADDLGTDRIHLFPVNEAATEGDTHSLLNESQQTDIKVEAGSGPRHLCFHPNQQFAYLMNEISGKVTVFSYDKGKFDAIQYIEADTVNAQGSADIHISPDGKFLYASNRLKADGLAIFAVDPEKGTLTKAGYQLTGIHPRNFIISRNGRYLLVACRDSHFIQVFERDKETGLLKDTGKTIKTHQPVCLKFIQ